MAQARLSVRKIREVLRLKAEARLSDRQIAEAIGSARSTVQECLRQDERNGYTGERSCQSVLAKLLAGQQVRELDPLDNQVEYPEVRLYFAGLVRSDPAGKTVLRCKAVELAARDALARKDVRP